MELQAKVARLEEAPEILSTTSDERQKIQLSPKIKAINAATAKYLSE